mgnify:CR=1 FL=1
MPMADMENHHTPGNLKPINKMKAESSQLNEMYSELFDCSRYGNKPDLIKFNYLKSLIHSIELIYFPVRLFEKYNEMLIERD